MQNKIRGVSLDKMKPFSQTIITSGFDGRNNVTRHDRKKNIDLKSSLLHLKKIASSFILFDWEFFSNELEYE